MLSLLINNFKKVVTLLIIGFLATVSLFEMGAMTSDNNYIVEAQTIQQRSCEIIIRAGEYEGKPGKRIYVNNQTLNIPNDIPIRNDNDGKGFYVSEWDINVKEAKALVKKLQAKGVNATLQISYNNSTD